jgi:Zn-dependent M28 family amino/carboxypeptidase
MFSSAPLHRGLALVVATTLLTACGDRSAEPAAPAANAPAPAQAAITLPAEAEAASNTISGDYLQQVIAEISDDRYEGRGPGTAGDELARKYLADELAKAGFEPGAADGKWDQTFDLVSINSSLPESWTFANGDKRTAYKWWDDYIATSGLQTQSSAVKDAEVVFVGYGIEAPEYDWNDFKGQDLAGKVLLMLNNDPDWDPALFQGTTRLYYGRWTYKYESAARQGAAGAIIIHTTPSAAYPWQVVQTSWTGDKFELPAGNEPRLQIAAWLTDSAARDLVKLAGKDLDALTESARSRDFKPVPLGIRTSLAAKNTIRRTQSANVLGLLRGSDPALSAEAVVLTAHHDHLGIGAPDEDGDRIYNGALDNGAGMAQVLAIARAFQALPQRPRRSILVAFVGAEEQGLLGSEHYALNPTFAPGRIAANVNYDGGNIWGRVRDVTFIGKGKSSLDAIVEAFAAKQGRVVKPDQFPDRGIFYRSDQFNFAKIGVPALYLDTGIDFIGREPGWGKERVEEFEMHHYHQPSDEIDASWVFDGMVDDTKLGFWTAYIVANADTAPTWVPGDEFEAARQKAVAAVAQ